MSRPLLSVEDLSVTFATHTGSVQALTDVSLNVGAGECLGIVGESGSGKSVLGRTVMNLLPGNAAIGPGARISFDSRDLRAMTRAAAEHFWGREISMVFQDPMTSLNPVRTIGAQICDPLRYHLGLGRRLANARAQELLAMVGLTEVSRRLGQYPHELSGGMRQRVMIAIAMACSPRLMIADEPTTALDVTVQKQILDLLKRLQTEQQLAVVLISHDLGLVAEYASRVAVMYAGRIVEVAPADALASGVRHRYTEALLRSTPKLSMAPHAKLETIPGRPPVMTSLIAGCPFGPRCAHATDICHGVHPTLDVSADGSLHTCHHPVGTHDAGPDSDGARTQKERL